MAKRLLDFTGSAGLLIVLSPLLLIVAAAVRLVCGPPVLFRQFRLGRAGRRFLIYKFRTMAPGCRCPSGVFKLRPSDPRIMPLGRFLRRWSLDELPQLVNVLKGEMSLVGPRPIVPAEAGQYAERLPILLSVRPGMTGIWQVSGRSRVKGSARTQMELWYAARRSIWTDLNILARTPLAVLSRRGAF